MSTIASSYQIEKIKLRQAKQLKDLFDRALLSDFGYFPADYIDSVRQQNSLLHLSSATLKQDRLLLGLWIDQLLTGYVIAKLSGLERAYIFWLYVSPEYRGRGLGNALLESSIDVINKRKISRVELITHNRKDFYLASGFVVDRQAGNVIGDVDVYMMSRELA